METAAAEASKPLAESNLTFALKRRVACGARPLMTQSPARRL
jgi:hypothetical protein